MIEITPEIQAIIDAKVAEKLLEAAKELRSCQIISRYKDAVFIRIPKILQLPTAGPCVCEACVKSGKPSMWDTMAVDIRTPKKGNDFTWTVHMPDNSLHRV